MVSVSGKIKPNKMVKPKKEIQDKLVKNNRKEIKSALKKSSKNKIQEILIKNTSEGQVKTTKEIKSDAKISREKPVLKKKKIKYVMPSKSVTEELVDQTLSALEQLTVHYKKKNTIFDDESQIFAEINCLKIQNSKGNVKFVLPHCTAASTGEICLVTPDLKKGRKVDHEPTVDHWEEILRNAGIDKIKTVLPMRQLRVEYDQYELKRRLLTQHDFIMVDTRVLNHVSHLLGKMFFKKHNMLIPVRLNEKANIKKDIDIGLRTAMLRLSEGPTSTLVIGHTGMSRRELKENVLSFVKQLAERYPGGEANIRSISLKLPLSVSLPLYITLRSASTAHAPKLTQKKPKHFVVLEDELSTLPGKSVRIAPDGTVHVKNSNNDITSDAEDGAEENFKESEDDEED